MPGRRMGSPNGSLNANAVPRSATHPLVGLPCGLRSPRFGPEVTTNRPYCANRALVGAPNSSSLVRQAPTPACRLAAVLEAPWAMASQELRTSTKPGGGRLKPQVVFATAPRKAKRGPKSARRCGQCPPKRKGHGLRLAATCPRTFSSQMPSAPGGTIHVRRSPGRRTPLAIRCVPRSSPWRE